MFALAIAPMAALPWLLSYWPSVDGPNHLALVRVLQSLEDGARSPFAAYLRSELRPGPYTLYYWLMLGLGRFLDLHLADRLIETAIIAGLPLAILYLVRRIAPERRANALLAAPLATGWLVMLGFVNFLLGLLFGLLALGAVWGRRGGRADPPAAATWRSRAAGSALLVLVAAAHPFALLLIGLALLLLEGPALRRVRTWATLVPVAAPAALLAAGPIALRWLEGGVDAAGPGATEYLWVGEIALRAVENTVLTFSSWELLLRGAPVLVLAWWALRAAGRARLAGPTRDDALSRLAVGLLVLYVAVPDKIRSIAFISPRLTLFFAIACAPLAARPRWAAPAWRVALAALPLVWGLTAVQYDAMARVDAKVGDIAAAGRAVPRGSTVLPLIFESRAHTANLFPLLHAWGHVVVERDVVVPYLFASGGTVQYGGGDFRPVRFLRRFSPSFLPNLGERSPPRLHDPYTEPRLLPTERLGFRLPPELLPWLAGVSEPRFDCTFDDWLSLRYRALVTAAASYDRVLAYAPDPEFLRAASRYFTVTARVGDAWVLRPLPAAAGAGAELICGEAR